MPNPTDYQFDLPAAGRPSIVNLKEEWYPGIQGAAINASSKRIYDPINGVRTVVIHATAGSSSAGAASVITNRKASFHWLVSCLIFNLPIHSQPAMQDQIYLAKICFQCPPVTQRPKQPPL